MDVDCIDEANLLTIYKADVVAHVTSTLSDVSPWRPQTTSAEPAT